MINCLPEVMAPSPSIDCDETYRHNESTVNDRKKCFVEYARAMPESLRASDDDRDTVLRALERHTAAGRLNLDEFDKRSTTALTAVTVDDLAALTADLPQLPDERERLVESAGHERHLMMIFVIAFVALAVLVAMMLLHP
jgi:Domain of unknown function (DUF1707)